MLKRLIEFVLHRHWFVLCLALLLVVSGLVAFLSLPFDAFPDTTPVMVQVNVSAPGWATDEIERQITYPIERELSGLSGLTEVRSISKYGISSEPGISGWGGRIPGPPTGDRTTSRGVAA